MIKDSIEKALNQQINEELKSYYIYLAMAADFEAKNWPGFAAWMKAQAGEEMGHAMKIFNFVNERGGKVVLKAIDAPPETWESPLAVFEAAYKHELFISGCIDKLVDKARQENDKAAEIFLQWFVTEQVEEELNADTIVNKLKLIQGSNNGMYMLDKELGARGK